LRAGAKWGAKAAAYLKAEMREAQVTHREMIERLAKQGFKETRGSLAMKLMRGTFSANFFLACLAALELEGVRLEDL
jgi:hypothetical protein